MGKWTVREILVCSGMQKENPHSLSMCYDCSPDKTSRTGSGRGLLGGWSEGALVLFTECVDVGVIVGGGSAAPLRCRLRADWL